MKKSLNNFYWGFLFIITITVFDPSFNLSASSSAIKSKTKSTVIKKQSSHVQSDVATQLNNQAQSLYNWTCYILIDTRRSHRFLRKGGMKYGASSTTSSLRQAV